MNELRDKIYVAIHEYMGIDDSDVHNLKRKNKVYGVGTVQLNDFEEWDDSEVSELTDVIMEKISPLVKDS